MQSYPTKARKLWYSDKLGELEDFSEPQPWPRASLTKLELYQIKAPPVSRRGALVVGFLPFFSARLQGFKGFKTSKTEVQLDFRAEATPITPLA